MSRGDPQARSLYAWEDAVVAPRDRTPVPFARLQALVDHVWAEEGSSAGASIARRVAHALTSDVDGNNAGHGPDFVAAYLRLLVRHARLDRAMLEASLVAAGIAWTRDLPPPPSGQGGRQG